MKVFMFQLVTACSRSLG